jgi:hypothetical protein
MMIVLLALKYSRSNEYAFPAFAIGTLNISAGVISNHVNTGYFHALIMCALPKHFFRVVKCETLRLTILNVL